MSRRKGHMLFAGVESFEFLQYRSVTCIKWVFRKVELFKAEVLHLFCTSSDNLRRQACVLLCLRSVNILMAPFFFSLTYSIREFFSCKTASLTFGNLFVSSLRHSATLSSVHFPYCVLFMLILTIDTLISPSFGKPVVWWSWSYLGLQILKIP